MKQTPKAICKFTNLPEKITVGTVLDLHCTWPSSLTLTPPIHIEFNSSKKAGVEPPLNKGASSSKKTKATQDLTKDHSSALFLLKIVDTGTGKGHFKVTSYRPGNYHEGFNLVSYGEGLPVAPLSWQVDSVISAEKKQNAKPYPPFGPWREDFPIWYTPFLLVFLGACLSYVAFKMHRFFKTKKKIREVEARLKGKKPFREFISQLNLLTREITETEGQKIFQKLYGYLCLFLENEFYIQALNTSPNKIFKQLKTSKASLATAQNTLTLLLEIHSLSLQKTKPEDCEQMLDRARELAIFYQEQKTKGES